LFTQVIAALVDQELVTVSRVSQDGVRVRVSEGSGSFRCGRPMTFFVQFKQFFSRDNCGILLDYPIGVWY
jgi:hypothetical protein